VSKAWLGVLVFFLLLCPFVSARYLTFSDNFNRADNATVGNNWNESLRPERFSISNNQLNVTRTTGDTYIKHYLGNNPSFGGGVTWMNVSFTWYAAARTANYGMNFQNGTFNQYSRGCGLWFPHMTGDNDLYNHYNNFANTELICSDCLSAGTTYRFSLIYNVSLQRIWVYIDGVKRGNISMFKSCQYARIIGFGIEDLAGQNFVDDVMVYNLSTIASVSSLLNVFASNKSFPLAKKSVFQEGEEFRVVANYTFNNGSVVSGGLCNSTVFNSSAERLALNASFSICSTCGKSYYSQKYNVSNASMSYDAVHFYACHEQLASGDLSVGLCSQSFTVPAASIPLCPATAFVFVNGSGCKARDYVNFSIAYNGPANRRKLVTGFSNDRFFSSRTVRMAYNSTPKWFFSNYSFEFYRHGLKNFMVNCSAAGFDKDLAGQVTIVNSPPVIMLNQLRHNLSVYNLSPNVKVEYSHGLWEFSSAVADDDLDYVKYELRNASFSLKSSWTRIPALQYYNSSLFVRAGSYNFSVWANDTFHNKSYKSVVFRVNDTGIPVCSGLSNKLVNNHSWVSWDIHCSDEYLYFFNLSCNNGFHKANSSIASTAWSYVNATSWRSSLNVTCPYEFCDGHTWAELPELDVSVGRIGLDGSVNRAAVSVEGITLSPLAVDASVRVSKLRDRYSMCYDFSKAKSDVISFPVPDGCFPAPNSKWKGHLLCPGEGLWIDFENSQGSVVDVVGSDVLVDISSSVDRSDVCFNSIGKFNCVSGSVFVENRIPPPEFWQVVNLSTASSIFLIGMVFVCLVLIVVGELFSDALIFRFIAAFVSLWVGFLFINYWIAFSMLWLVLAVLYLVRAVYFVVADF